jgi:hypothetical protein
MAALKVHDADQLQDHIGCDGRRANVSGFDSLMKRRCSECGEPVHVRAKHSHSGFAARANHDLCQTCWGAAVARAQGANMANEYTASIENFISTALVEHPRLGRVRMNVASYNPDRDGPNIEGPNQPPPTLSVHYAPDKEPKVNEDGKPITDLHSPLLRA